MEIWRPVIGFEMQYEVSNLGNVRSLDRSWKQISRSGKEYIHNKKGKNLKPGIMTRGHLSVAIGRKNSRTIHSLVMEAFVSPRPKNMEILHINGNPSDNCLDNLRYGTRSENIKDAVKHGTWHSEKRKKHWARLASPLRTEARRLAAYKAWETRKNG
jgi:hypothetical protein